MYGLAKLTRRINERALPTTRIIDMREKRSVDRAHSGVFTYELERQIQKRLDNKEQVILLVNRRGYSSVVCSDCGYLHVCPACHGSLTYHKEDDLLKCHHCGYVDHYPESCPECGSTKIQRIGLGTERVVKILGELFPNAKVGRLDSDIAKSRLNIPKVLAQFRNKEFDILVGTQMVAKGHDFPDVTLAGLVSADQGLAMQSYRSAETTFGLIAQSVGRSGRGAKVGEALIQTYNPAHYAIVFGAKQDYESFYRREMQQRKISAYPPFYFLIAVTFSSKDEEKTIRAGVEMKEYIAEKAGPEVLSIGPIAPYYALVGGFHKRTVLFKTKKPDELKPLLKEVSTFSASGGVDISFDVDPLDY